MVGRDQQDQILYLSKDLITQIWNLERTETELHREPPDKVLEAITRLVSAEQRECTGTPSKLAETAQTGMMANALIKYLNVKCGKLAEDYGVDYENKTKHSGRRVKITYNAKYDGCDGRNGENDTTKTTVAIVATVAERIGNE